MASMIASEHAEAFGDGEMEARGRSSLPRRLLNSIYKNLIYICFPVAILIIWQIVVQTGIYKPKLLPSPVTVASVWYDLITGAWAIAGPYAGTWPGHALASVWRVYAGFTWGVGFGIMAGLLIGLSKPLEKLFDPTIQLLRNVPVTAWVPLSVIFFGIADRPAIFLIGLGAFFPAVVNSTHGVRQVDITLCKAALMMGVNQRQLLAKVILPASLPSVFTGIRLGMGIAWVLVVVSEMIAVKSGLGYLLNDAYWFYRVDVVIATMFSIGLLGYVSDRMVVAIRNRILQWNVLETYSG